VSPRVLFPPPPPPPTSPLRAFRPSPLRALRRCRHPSRVPIHEELFCYVSVHFSVHCMQGTPGPGRGVVNVRFSNGVGDSILRTVLVGKDTWASSGIKVSAGRGTAVSPLAWLADSVRSAKQEGSELLVSYNATSLNSHHRTTVREVTSVTTVCQASGIQPIGGAPGVSPAQPAPHLPRSLSKRIRHHRSQVRVLCKLLQSAARVSYKWHWALRMAMSTCTLPRYFAS